MKKRSFNYSIVKVLFLTGIFLLSCSQFAMAKEDIYTEVKKKSEQTSQKKSKSSKKAKSGDKAKSSGSKSKLGDPAKGKKLFKTNCASCHRRYKKLIGPALHGITDKQSLDWIYSWIHNSQAMVDSGDPDAVAIYKKFNKQIMPPFPQLSKKDIRDILAYVEQPKPEPKTTAASGGGGAAAAGQTGGGGMSTAVILVVLVFVLILLVIILILVNKTLTNFAKQSDVELPQPKKKGPSLWKAFIHNQFLVIVVSIIFMLGASYFAYAYMMQIGVDQGYQPVQPIHFSHRIHAGMNGIQCKYCHSSARKSKVSGVPSLNVCMNCHMQISEVAKKTATEEYSKEYYDKQIQKLYDAVGWNPDERAYTGDTEPVEWVRVHNLPDLVYFNHSQHVNVGGIDCQRCHGPVEEYEIMKQYAPLTMGWCIQCHRDTNVKMEGNGYYKKIHEQLSTKYGVEELTAAQMGALECGKCHY